MLFRRFLLAASLLGECEFHKAEKLFLTAAKGIYTDQFFADRIKAESTPELPNRTFITYYLKVRIEKAIFTVQHYIFIFLYRLFNYLSYTMQEIAQ